MESVLLGRDATAEPRPPQRVAGALAVRNVQQRWRGARILPAADKVRGTTGAAVERVAGTADNPRELLAHAPQPRNAGIDLVDLRRHPHPQRLRRRPRVASSYATARRQSAAQGETWAVLQASRRSSAGRRGRQSSRARRRLRQNKRTASTGRPGRLPPL